MKMHLRDTKHFCPSRRGPARPWSAVGAPVWLPGGGSIQKSSTRENSRESVRVMIIIRKALGACQTSIHGGIVIMMAKDNETMI